MTDTPPKRPKRDLTPRTADRKAYIDLLNRGVSPTLACERLQIPRSTGLRWARLWRLDRAKQEREKRASVPALEPGELTALGPRELLDRLANDSNVLPGYRINAAAALLRLDSGAKEERIIPASTLDWLESLDGQEVEGK